MVWATKSNLRVAVALNLHWFCVSLSHTVDAPRPSAVHDNKTRICPFTVDRDEQQTAEEVL